MNTNNTPVKSTSKWHIVLTDKYNQPQSWKGFQSLAEAFARFSYLYERMNYCTDGDFRMVDGTEYPTFADEDGNKVTLVPSNAKLTFNLIFASNVLAREMFDDMIRREM